MDEKKENAQLSDEELDEVTGGFGGHDDYDVCEWNPNGTGSHSWVLDSSRGCLVCEYCGIRM